MEGNVRTIITLDLLKEIFKGESKKAFLHELVRIYSHDFQMAYNMLTARSLEIIGVNEQAASVWIDMRNALTKMSSKEAEALRTQCKVELANQATVHAGRFSKNYCSIREIIEFCIATQQAGTNIHSLINNIDFTIQGYITGKFQRYMSIKGESLELKELLGEIVNFKETLE